MRHRDVSEWDRDMIDYAKTCWQTVPCEEHINCLRDETDEEVCKRLHDRLLATAEEAMDFRGIVSWDGQVRS